MSQVIFFISGLLLGFIIGFAVGRKIKGIPNWERAMLAVVITVLWGTSVVVSLVNPEYTTPTALHGILGVVAGYFFQGSIIEAVKNWKQPKPPE